MSLMASLVITTKNRKDDLRVALRSASGQTSDPEIIVIDDGSSDGTSEMVRAEFPEVRLYSNPDSKGYIVRRNEGANLASGEIIFSIDDDAEFSSHHVMEHILSEFSDSSIGAIAIPYIEPHKDDRLLQKAPDENGCWITDRFIGTSHALRRDLFLKLGGYRESLIHQGEEGDLCIRMLDYGFFVRLGCSDPIIHHESPKRSYHRMDYYGCRNSILFLWQNAPWRLLPLFMLGTTLNCLKWTLDPMRLWTRMKGLLAGYCNCFTASRAPVSEKTFREWRYLGKKKFVSLDAPRTSVLV
jgi:glycosyltransferase involved in cell wall biosynthesis